MSISDRHARVQAYTEQPAYVDLQEYMDDASMLDDLIEEFEGLKQVSGDSSISTQAKDYL